MREGAMTLREELAARLRAVIPILCEAKCCVDRNYCDIHDAPDYDRMADAALALVVERCAMTAYEKVCRHSSPRYSVHGDATLMAQEIAAAIRALAGEGHDG